MKRSLSFLAIVCLLALLPVSSLLAQDGQTSNHHNLKLAFEFGTSMMSNELVKPEQIRENHSSYYYYRGDYNYDYGFIKDYSSMSTTYLGVKPEIFIYKNRIGIASGLRYTMTSVKLVSDRDNFLWKVKEDGLNTGYVRIDDIREKTGLLSIPVEVRYFMNGREMPFQTYFKIGVSLNYRIHSEYQVNFSSKAMEKYNNQIQDLIPENDTFSSFVFGAVGFKIGRYTEGKWAPWGNIEFQFPYAQMSEVSFAFAGLGVGAGIQVSFQIPIGKNMPIGSK
jgi:hypothetical protein